MNYVEHTYVGTQNSSGDDQLHLDIDCDNAVFAAVRQSGVYAIAASEETPVETDVSSSSSTTTTKSRVWLLEQSMDDETSVNAKLS